MILLCPGLLICVSDYSSHRQLQGTTVSSSNNSDISWVGDRLTLLCSSGLLICICDPSSHYQLQTSSSKRQQHQLGGV
jgi:hypothetical protein